MKVGFMGLGHMGEPMARNLMHAGHELTVYNRTRAKAERLGRKGARIAPSPAEAAAGADVLITMLADDSAVRTAVLGGDAAQPPAIETLRGIHMSSSTISVEMSKELEAAHHARGQRYIAAPVIGRAEAAAERRIWVIAAGPRVEVDYCRPLMEALGRGISDAGTEPWKANLVKIGVNFFIAATLESLGEVFALMEKSGIDSRKFLDVLNGGSFQSPVIGNYGARILDQNYEPAGFALNLGLKDTGLTLEQSVAARVPMPFAGILRDHFLEALAHGLEKHDWSAVAEIPRVQGGLRKTLTAGG